MNRIVPLIVLLSFFSCFATPQLLSAQSITILNASNQSPMIGATVSFLHSKQKLRFLSSNANGEVIVPSHYYSTSSFLIVQVSFIGFKTQTDTIYKNRAKVIALSPQAYLQDAVVVTAQYSPTTTEQAIHKVRVISSQKIESMAAVNLEDVLSNELNVRISQDNILGSGMSMQGISGQNVKILIDGVPVIGRLDGQIDLSQINLNEVEHIEIVEGPLSVNYGSNALAGTINIITKKQSKELLSVGIDSYLENIGTYNFTVKAATQLKRKHSIRTSLGRNYFDGWNEGDDFLPSFNRQRADSSRAKQWNQREQYFGRLNYNYSFKELTIGYKGELFDERISNLGLPRKSGNSFIAFDDYYHTKRIDNSVFLNGKLSEAFNINWTTAYNDYERIKEARRKDLVSLNSVRIPESSGNDQQDTSTFNLFLSRGSISSTNDSCWINYELGYDINLEQAAGKRIDGREQKLGDYAAFVSSELKLTEVLFVKPAVRYGYNTKYNAPLTPSIHLKYTQRNATIRLSYAKGFRAPSLKELYFNFDDINHSLFGNQNLKAERSDNYTASIQRKILVNSFLFKPSISVFYNQIYNQINFAQSNNFGGGDTLVYFNVGENETKGLNFAVSIAHDHFQANVGMSYTGRFNQLAKENPIDKFSYSTELVANVSYEIKRFNSTIAVFFKHQGELPGFGYTSSGEVGERITENYQLLDATLSKYFLQKRLRFSLGCKNILNVINVQSTLSSGGAHSSNSGSIGTGRTVFTKLSFTFSKQ